jgi:hypothetical protein
LSETSGDRAGGLLSQERSACSHACARTRGDRHEPLLQIAVESSVSLSTLNLTGCRRPARAGVAAAALHPAFQPAEPMRVARITRIARRLRAGRFAARFRAARLTTLRLRTLRLARLAAATGLTRFVEQTGPGRVGKHDCQTESQCRDHESLHRLFPSSSESEGADCRPASVARIRRPHAKCAAHPAICKRPSKRPLTWESARKSAGMRIIRRSCDGEQT